MKMFRNLVTVFGVLHLSACVSLQQTVTVDAAPVPESGYVVGSFTTTKGSGFGFGIVSPGTDKKYVMPFGQDTLLPSERKDQLSMIQLPPGEYRIGYWTTYSTLTKELMGRKDVDNPAIGARFTVAPGSVVFIGNYSADTTHSYNQIHWTIRQNDITLQEARKVFAGTYPKFAELPFSCTVCLK